jgi:small subunit ribosomal protein S3
MIERQFIAQKTKEYYIKQYIENKLKGVGISQIKLKKIPLGEKIIIYTSRPSLIVGSRGANIRDLTRVLKQDFKLENPQIEINEVKNPFVDAMIVAERIASSLERFGSARFKSIGHKVMENVIKSGALGIEVIISGKIPGARAKSWRFYQGYLKKCGDIAVTGVQKAKTAALLKTGIIGIQVSIMPPDIVLPDYVNIKKELVQESSVKDVKEGSVSEVASEEGEKAEGKGKKKASATSEKEKTEKKKAPRKKADANVKENKAEKEEVTSE